MHSRMLHDIDWKMVAHNSEDYNALKVLFTSKQLQVWWLCRPFWMYV